MKKGKISKKIVVSVLLCTCLVLSTAQAFVFDLSPVNKEAVAKFTDRKLTDTYIDVMIELEAAGKFFSNTGMKPKEYKKYKELLRYRTDLMIEIQKRELEVPETK